MSCAADSSMLVAAYLMTQRNSVICGHLVAMAIEFEVLFLDQSLFFLLVICQVCGVVGVVSFYQ